VGVLMTCLCGWPTVQLFNAVRRQNEPEWCAEICACCCAARAAWLSQLDATFSVCVAGLRFQLAMGALWGCRCPQARRCTQAVLSICSECCGTQAANLDPSLNLCLPRSNLLHLPWRAADLGKHTRNRVCYS
jgi:hypothetical protein